MADTTTNKKKSRTEEMLEQLKVGPDFLDYGLPKGCFSHSQYNSYKTCAKAYEFKYVLGVAEPSSPATSRGSAVHKGIEAALKRKMAAGKALALEEAREEVQKEFDERANQVQNWEDAKPADMKKEALSLYEAFHVHALPKINPVAIEKGFAVKFAGVPMVGWIDLIDEQPAMDVTNLPKDVAATAPKMTVVADFKTAKSKWSEKDVRLDTQLTLYSAIEGTPHVRVDQLIPYKGKGATYVRAPSERTPADIAILEEDVAEVADFIKRGIFPRTTVDSWKCNAKWCSFWSLCRGAKS